VSTFGGLNAAMSGLNAARAALETAGNNIANVNTPGYTRQRADIAAIGPTATMGLLSGGPRVGQGAAIVGIARLADGQLDARVRGTGAAAGLADTRAAGLSNIEGMLREPGEQGLSALLNKFWAGWQGVANQPGGAAPAATVLESARNVATRLSSSRAELEGQWNQERSSLDSTVSELNTAAGQVAALNGSIRSVTAAGGNANELLDRRSALTTRIAELAGGTVREAGDGTIDVLVGGNALVSGTTARAVVVAGGIAMGAAAPTVEWAHRPGGALGADGGRLAGSLSLLAPSDGAGTGGAYAETAAALDGVARSLSDQVNAVHAGGTTADGRTGLDFFSYDAANPAASLAVLATGARDLATRSPGGATLDGSNADRLSGLSGAAGGPDALWSSIVLGVGLSAQSEAQQSVVAAVAATSAAAQQQSGAGVSLDEENVALLAHQHAYQGAARVMTAIDEMLDTLINRTGVVGR
jgi:flagellar hook-associated protein 1 FlgK